MLHLIKKKLKIDKMFGHQSVEYVFKSVLGCVSDNKIKTLPESLCQLPCLRLLDVSNNDMTMLPNKLCHVRTLESLICEGNPLNSPSKGSFNCTVNITSELKIYQFLLYVINLCQE